MELTHLTELRLKEATYWWHVNRHRLVLKFLDLSNEKPSQILDVGCGGGYLSSTIARAGNSIISSDIIFDAARFVKIENAVDSLVFDAGKTWPVGNKSFQTVIMLDVLEHIQNENDCLKEVRRILADTGTLILSVPAHQFLYSGWDKVLGHYRRYSKSHLGSILDEAGFKPVVLSYQNAISLLPALFMRIRERRSDKHLEHAKFPDVPKFVNSFLKLWGRMENWLIPGKVPFGLSIFVVAKVKKEGQFAHT